MHYAQAARRTALLEELGLLNSETDAAWDRLTRIASRVTGCPIALVTFVGPDRQWIPSHFGWNRDSTSLLEAFCVEALSSPGLLEIHDVSCDDRFRNNPLTQGPEAIRFYAGFPVLFDGIALGTVCVLDYQPAALDAAGRSVLADLAGMVSDRLQLQREKARSAMAEYRSARLADELSALSSKLARAQRIAKIGSWEVDTLTGESFFSNELYEVIGRDPSLGPINVRDFALFVDPQDRARFKSMSRRIAEAGTPVDDEFRITTVDGEHRWLHGVSEAVFDEHGTVSRVLGTLQDVTERKTSERAIRRTDLRYRSLWETTTDVVVILDESNRIQFANPAVSVVFGHVPETLIGLDIGVLQPERLRPSHRRGFERFLATGQRLLDWRGVEAIGLHADGTEFEIEISFNEVRDDDGRVFAAFMRDVRVRKQEQRALQASETRFRSLTALSSDWYWEQDCQSRLTSISGGLHGQTNFTLANILGKTPWEAAGSAMSDEDWLPHKEVLSRRASYRDLEIRHLLDDGTLRVMSISGEPMFDTEGLFVGYRGVGRDVTERVSALVARQTLEEQLRESQKMEALGVLAGGVAHDFNNIVAAILGNVHLASTAVSREAAADNLAQVRKAALRGRGLISQILAFARRRSTELRKQQLLPILSDSISLLRAALPAGVAIVNDLETEPLIANVDVVQIEQVLMNLGTNAWHAVAGKAGVIEISLHRLVLNEDEALSAGVSQGSFARIRVRDNGLGMTAEVRSRIFEPFFTTKPVGEGTGLGLAVVHGIVAAHGGVIKVDSLPGQGSTFDILLPAHSDSGMESSAKSPTEDALGQGEHVLYVDDDEVMVLMVEALLSRLGYRTTCLQRPGEAISALKANPAAFDVVVTDLNMPDLSGVELADAIRKIRSDLPVVISSGNLIPGITLAARRVGVRAVMRKQYTLEEIGQLLRVVLSGGEKFYNDDP